MKLLIDFVSLRPIWTRRGIEIVWYIYLLATALSVAQFFGFSLWGAPVVAQLWVLLATFLFYVAHLALVRIFLELALKFLTETSAQPLAPGAGMEIPD